MECPGCRARSCWFFFLSYAAGLCGIFGCLCSVFWHTHWLAHAHRGANARKRNEGSRPWDCSSMYTTHMIRTTSPFSPFPPPPLFSPCHTRPILTYSLVPPPMHIWIARFLPDLRQIVLRALLVQCTLYTPSKTHITIHAPNRHRMEYTLLCFHPPTDSSNAHGRHHPPPLPPPPPPDGCCSSAPQASSYPTKSQCSSSSKSPAWESGGGGLPSSRSASRHT